MNRKKFKCQAKEEPRFDNTRWKKQNPENIKVPFNSQMKLKEARIHIQKRVLIITT